jgi:hypothetical protein
MASPLSLLQPTTSTNTGEDEEEVTSLTEQPRESSILDDDDLTRQVEQCFRNDSEQQSEVNFMEIARPSRGKQRRFLFYLIKFN